jgi:hypothetical protein
MPQIRLDGFTMQTKVTEITYDVELRPGEALTLPADAAAIIGPGRWRVSITSGENGLNKESVRDHSAFLNSYVPEDEGLYDDCSGG